MLIDTHDTDYKLLSLSAGISIFVYFLLALLFILYMMEQSVKKYDSVAKVTVLELDIVLEDSEEKEQKRPSQSEQNKSPKASKSVKKTTSKSAKKKTDIKSLFAKVSTKSAKVEEDRVLNISKSTITSRHKAKFEQSKKNDDIKISNLIEKKNRKKIVISNNNENRQSDPFYSEIHSLISSRWNPAFLVDGLEAVAVVTIDNRGNFTYKIVKYSGNSSYDDSLAKFLESQTNKKYPPFQSGQKTSIEITFKSKG